MSDRNTTDNKKQASSPAGQDEQGKHASPFKEDLSEEQQTETPEEEASEEQQRKEALTERD